MLNHLAAAVQRFHCPQKRWNIKHFRTIRTSVWPDLMGQLNQASMNQISTQELLLLVRVHQCIIAVLQKQHFMAEGEQGCLISFDQSSSTPRVHATNALNELQISIFNQ